jgi:Glycosyltransferase family 92
MVAPVGLIVLWCISVAWRSATLYDGSSLSVSNPSVVKVAIQIDENTLSADATKRTAAIRPLKRTKATTTNELHQKQKTLQPSTSDSLHNNPNVLTLFLEPPSTLDLHSRPLARRRTTASKLTRVEFPKFSGNCDYDSLATRQLPIDDFPEADPFLPWLHDYHVDASVMRVRFVAQNKRRCETGTGKEIVMKYWEPQVALFQPVPVIEEQTVGMDGTSQSVYRLATSPTNATAPETRFLCRFHLRNDQQPLNDAATRTTTRTTSLSRTTFSTFDFNYEFIMWRKRRMPMFHETGSDVSKLEMSQLLFSCPIPDEFRPLIRSSSSSSLPAAVLLDLVPIRTPTRQLQQLFTEEHIGASSLKIEQGANTWFNASAEFGMDHVLPDVADSGRWANLPLCPSHAVDQRMRESYTTATNKLAVAQPHDRTTSVERSRRLNGKDEVGNVDDSTASSKFDKRRYSLVACTWTAASYFRRGDATVINDSASRLKEWIVFHQLAGVEHFYVYDNTKPSEYQDHHDENTGRSTRQSPLRDVCNLFPSSLVTHIAWPASVCSNNRPNFQNPGERSSQYAADAACRSNYGEHTEWMTFLDTDEYLVPMRQQQQKNDPGDVNYGGMGETMAPTWQHVLRKYETQEIDVLKLKSSRGRPRLAYMDVTDDPSVCVRRNRRVNKLAETTCAIPSRNTTFLQVYK